jgi:tetratricopeptide (TPR) repeat protein
MVALPAGISPHRNGPVGARRLRPAPLDAALAVRWGGARGGDPAARSVDARAPRAVPTLPLIGREREAGELRAALDAALGGCGRLVLLGGEPGIGKTRLASALADEAGARGVPVWWGRGWEDGSAPAFWSWDTALRRWTDQAGHEAVTAAAGSSAAELAHVFPVLRDRMPRLLPSEASAAEGARFRLFDLVSRFLAALARPAGLVVVLDDVHWADRPSLKLLEFIAADLAEARVLVVATYRDTEVHRRDPFFDTLSRLAREAPTRRLQIGGLSPAHCERWIALAGLRGDPAALGEQLHRETNGNPFFVGEIVRLLAGEGEDLGRGWDPQRVPHSVREVIARRLSRLGDDCRAALAVAALVGDTIEAGMLADLLGGTSLADHLARAERSRIVVERAGRPGQYGFAHALIRRVLVDDLEPSTRAAWHARIATVLEAQATASVEVTTELVRHLAAAGTSQALRKAFDHACRGAEQAARGLGWEEAVRLYEIALDLGRRSGLLDPGRAIELRLALARALRGASDVPAARACCEEVMAACRRTPDPETLARAALIHAGPIPEWGRIDPAVRAVLEEAYRRGLPLDDTLRARLSARLAGDLIAANEVEQSARIFALCDEAAAAAQRADSPGVLAIALLGTYTASVIGMRPAAPGGTVPCSEDILAAAEAGGEHEYAAAIRYLRAMTLLASGEPEAFSSEVDGLATAAAASRVPEALWLADALAALRATVQGRFADAQEAMERAFATGRRAQLPNAVGVYASQRIMWHAFQGRLAEIAPEIEAFVDAHPRGAGWRPVRALARLAGGDAVAARAEFQGLLAAGIAPAERGVMARSYLMGLAVLCVALRDREHAPLLYDCIANRGDAWSTGGGQTLGPWALALGGLAHLSGRPADAIGHFETAIRLGRRMGSRPIVARAQSLLASVCLTLRPAAEERDRIAVLLAEAAQGAQELGLVDVAARVVRLHAKLSRNAVAPSGNAFRRDGDVWTVRYAGRDLRVKDGKGPRYLATLLGAPGREVHVLEFGARAAVPTRPGVHEGLSIGLPGRLDDAPDERARREYRARLDDLRAELEEAESFADTGRAERLRAEQDQLVAQLARRFGTRAACRGPAETARKAVTKVLRTQIGKLLDTHPALGRHLRDAVRMGTVCVYAPPTSVAWEVGFGPD